MKAIQKIKMMLIRSAMTLDRAILQRTADADKWDESKHPRKQNGQFGKGGNSLIQSRKSDNVKNEKIKFDFNLSLFGVDYSTMPDKQVRKSAKSLEKKINEHIYKYNHPDECIEKWDKYDSRHKDGLLSYWEKEINRFKKQRAEALEELRKRGKK